MKQPGYYARLILWILLGILFGYLIGKHVILVDARNKDIAKAPETNGITPVPIEVTPTLTPKQKTIEDDIREVFGVNAGKALMLLRGTGPNTCAENRNLDPKALNINPGGTKDIGVFQINSFYQKISNEKFLYDPAINIRIAYKIFVDNDYSFSAWTCGKKYGI